MARARLLKPGFFSNEHLADVSIAGRLLFAGLWTIADREGRLEDRPKRIKGELFRYENIDVESLLTELVNNGFIDRYEVEGVGYIQVLRFKEHQKPHQNEPPSAIPPSPSPNGTSARAVYIAVTSSGNRNDDPVGVPLDDAAPPPPAKREKKRPLTEAVIEAIQAEEPTLDIPAMAADYLNWKGAAGHTDQVQGFRNQLRIEWKRNQFTKGGTNGRTTTPRGTPPNRHAGWTDADIEEVRRYAAATRSRQ